LPFTGWHWLLPFGKLTLPGLESGAAAVSLQAAPGPLRLPGAEGHADFPFGSDAVDATPGPSGAMSEAAPAVEAPGGEGCAAVTAIGAGGGDVARTSSDSRNM